MDVDFRDVLAGDVVGIGGGENALTWKASLGELESGTR